MDSSSYERLSRFAGPTRRRFALLSAVGGATVATGLLATAADGAEKKNKRCKKKLRKCRKKECPACEALLVREPCETTSQCCGTETNMACGRLDGGPPGETVCCGTNTAPCTIMSDCCLGFTCNEESNQCRLSL